MILTTTRLLLRDFDEDDCHATHAYESDPRVVRYQSHGPRTLEESREYIRRVRAESQQVPRRLYDLAVVLAPSGPVIGRCGINLDSDLRQAALWYVLHRDHWGRGYVPEAARALVDFGFTRLGLHRVWADCDPANTASVRVAEKLGMRREAHFRENAWIKGAWSDSLIFAVLEREWVPLAAPTGGST